MLISSSIQIKKTDNWVIKYPSNDIEDISIARELGFQPLKLVNTWIINKEIHHIAHKKKCDELASSSEVF